MSLTPIHPRRADETFVIMGASGPYHVTQEDPLYLDVLAAWEALGSDAENLPPEPAPLSAPPPQDEPSKAALMAELARISALVAALPD